jgi:hypothetical protein
VWDCVQQVIFSFLDESAGCQSDLNHKVVSWLWNMWPSGPILGTRSQQGRIKNLQLPSDDYFSFPDAHCAMQHDHQFNDLEFIIFAWSVQPIYAIFKSCTINFWSHKCNGTSLVQILFSFILMHAYGSFTSHVVLRPIHAVLGLFTLVLS